MLVGKLSAFCNVIATSYSFLFSILYSQSQNHRNHRVLWKLHSQDVLVIQCKKTEVQGNTLVGIALDLRLRLRIGGGYFNLLLVCLHDGVCELCLGTRGGQRQLCGIASLFPPLYGFQGLNSSYQDCISSTFSLVSHHTSPILREVMEMLSKQSITELRLQP